MFLTFSLCTPQCMYIYILGWANRPSSDVATLDVGEVVGPPYAVLTVSPAARPVTGGGRLSISGVNFAGAAEGLVIVRFVLTSSSAAESGEESSTAVTVVDVSHDVVYVDDETIACPVPNVVAHMRGGDIAAEVRVSIGGDAFTTTFAPFTFFPTTDPSRSVVAGPGITSGVVAGVAAPVRVEVSDALGVRRSTGGDIVTFRARLMEEVRLL